MNIIRLAEERDIEQIKVLYRETILSVNIRDYTLEQVELWANRGTDDNIWRKRINEEYFIVSESNDQIVGFCSLQSTGYLNTFFIHKDFQKQGIGKALLSNVEKHARELKIKEISADVSLTANGFFRKNGYEDLGQQTICIGIPIINNKMLKKLDKKKSNI